MARKATRKAPLASKLVDVAEMMNLEAVPQPDCPPVFISVNVKANVARLVPSMLAASVLGKGCSMVL